MIQKLRANKGAITDQWPPMKALGPLIADSRAIVLNKYAVYERNAFNYGNIAPLITRVARFVDNSMFWQVVDLEGGYGCGEPLDWQQESTKGVDQYSTPF